MKSSTFSSLQKSMEEGLEIAKGNTVKGTLISEFIVHDPKKFSASAIKKLRTALGVSQPVFAQILGVSVNALRNWEQNRNSPSNMARRFLEVIENDPSSFLDQAEDMQIIEQNKQRA